jgi:hypothetical protein
VLRRADPRWTRRQLRAVGGRVFGQVVQAGEGAVELAGRAVAGPGGLHLVAAGTRAIGFPLVRDEGLVRASAAAAPGTNPRERFWRSEKSLSNFWFYATYGAGQTSIGRTSVKLEV